MNTIPENALEKTYLRGLAVFIVAFLVVLLASLVYPFYQAERQRLIGELTREAERKAVYADLFIKNSHEKVAASGSRTLIRAKLVEYAAGKVSLAELAAFTEPKYLDGLAVYDDVITAVRYDAAGGIVAAKGEMSLLPFLPLTMDCTILELRQFNAREGSKDTRYALEIRHPILDHGRVIGQDALLFDAHEFNTDTGDIIYRLYASGDPVYQGESSNWHSVATSNAAVSLAYRYPDRVIRPQLSSFLLPILRFALLLVLILGLVAYFTLYRSSRRVLDSLRSLAERRALLIKETNHRVKNNLAIISSLIHLYREEDDGENKLAEIESKIGLIGLIHDRLYRAPDAETVAIKPYLQELVTSILAAHAAPGTYTNAVDGHDLYVRDDVCAGIGIIVSELILNALKYALGPGDGIWITLTEDASGWSLCFENSGKPYPEDVNPETSTGFGSELIRMYTDQLGGTLHFSKKPRTRYWFEFGA